MGKIKRPKWYTIIYKAQHRLLKIEQHEPSHEFHECDLS